LQNPAYQHVDLLMSSVSSIFWAETYANHLPWARSSAVFQFRSRFGRTRSFSAMPSGLKKLI